MDTGATTFRERRRCLPHHHSVAAGRSYRGSLPKPRGVCSRGHGNVPVRELTTHELGSDQVSLARLTDQKYDNRLPPKVGTLPDLVVLLIE